MANFIDKMFKIAAKNAIKENSDYRRKAMIGAVGIRNDGAIVCSKNLPNNAQLHEIHAERLLSAKLDKGATVFVARVNRNGDYCNSRPCFTCERTLRLKGIKKVYYTITNEEYGVINF